MRGESRFVGFRQPESVERKITNPDRGSLILYGKSGYPACPALLFRHCSRLKVEFGAKTVEISINCRDRQLPAVPAIGYGAIACLGFAIDLGIVPSFRVAHITDPEVILLRPEERDGIKYLAAAKNVARGGLPLTLGDDKMLDPDTFTGKSVRPARDVAGRENPRDTCLKVLVDDDAAINAEPSSFRQRDHWPYPDSNEDNVRLEAFAILQRYVSLVYRGHCRAEMKCHSMFLVESADEIPDLRSQDVLHRNCLEPNHVHVDIPVA
jgi:hypothetical protein